MSDFLHIEPATEHRSGFALWCLGQDPVPNTTSTGFDVPLGLYAAIPAEVLDGAYVDGYQVSNPPAPTRLPDELVDALQDVAEGVPDATPIGGPRTQEARRRRARKDGD